jgi:hypothetical protein
VLARERIKARGVSQGVKDKKLMQIAKCKLQIERQNAKHGATEEIQSGTESSFVAVLRASGTGEKYVMNRMPQRPQRE